MELEKTTWLIADMYYPSESMSGSVHSHEAICVLNPSDQDAQVDIVLYFEDREPMQMQMVCCPAKRTNHIRMDLIKTAEGLPVPQDTPYAALITTSVGTVVQYSRADARQNALSTMTTIAYPV